MKIKNYEIINHYKNLKKILEECSFSVETCFKIVKNKKKIEELVNLFDEAKKTIILSECKKNDKGEPIINDNNYIIEDMAKAEKRIQELLMIEHDVDFEQILVADLGAETIKGEYVETLSMFFNEL